MTSPYLSKLVIFRRGLNILCRLVTSFEHFDLVVWWLFGPAYLVSIVTPSWLLLPDGPLTRSLSVPLTRSLGRMALI